MKGFGSTLITPLVVDASFPFLSTHYAKSLIKKKKAY
jgi:hypothetical protein